jgi:hypothetical protein
MNSDVPEYNNTICIRVCDASTIMQSSDEIILGEVEILLKELDDPNKVKNKWWKLSPSREKSIGEVRLTLQFSVSTTKKPSHLTYDYIYVNISVFAVVMRITNDAR